LERRSAGTVPIRRAITVLYGIASIAFVASYCVSWYCVSRIRKEEGEGELGRKDEDC
jgi:hypothetical protein